jgi:hypothetical protein
MTADETATQSRRLFRRLGALSAAAVLAVVGEDTFVSLGIIQKNKKRWKTFVSRCE